MSQVLLVSGQESVAWLILKTDERSRVSLYIDMHEQIISNDACFLNCPITLKSETHHINKQVMETTSSKSFIDFTDEKPCHL